MDQDYSHAHVIVLGPPRPPHHLEHVRDRVVDVAVRLSVVVLRSLDDDEVGGEVHPPGKGARGYEYLRRGEGGGGRGVGGDEGGGRGGEGRFKLHCMLR